MKQMSPMRRLPLQGAQNTRDLGGYPCPGGTTRWQSFLRSDNPGALTEHDREVLHRYGVDTAIDLRRADEIEKMPSTLSGDKRFTNHAISLNDDIEGIDFEGDLPGSMAGLYISLLKGSRPQIVAVMEAMAKARGGVLFHCAVGKDRTGVIAMLLLQLAGVSDADIIADYAVTDIYMHEIFDAQAEVFKGRMPDYVLRSRPASMERVLRHLHSRHGGAASYLAACGLGESTLKALRQKLVDTAE